MKSSTLGNSSHLSFSYLLSWLILIANFMGLSCSREIDKPKLKNISVKFFFKIRLTRGENCLKYGNSTKLAGDLGRI